MPGGDGTGPMGAGAMTGRGAGSCTDAGVRGNPVPSGSFGMGFRRGFAGGRFGRFGRFGGAQFGRVANVQEGLTISKEEQISVLKCQVEDFEDALSSIRKQLVDLEK